MTASTDEKLTHTSPIGAYVDPVMVNSLREQVSPSTLSRMNICKEIQNKSSYIRYTHNNSLPTVKNPVI